VITTPLGIPVEPEVNRMYAGSPVAPSRPTGASARVATSAGVKSPFARSTRHVGGGPSSQPTATEKSP
jgi:hypothetical protein